MGSASFCICFAVLLATLSGSLAVTSVQAEARIVSSARDLGAALQDNNVKWIIIKGKMRLSKETWVPGGTVVVNRHVILESDKAAPASAVLDLGALVDAIHVAPGAHLELLRLRIPNAGNRQLRRPSMRVRMRVAGIFALWPSVTLAKDSRMSFEECVFYYWSDKEWDSCDKFREAAEKVLNPKNLPGMLEWSASDTQVYIHGSQNTTQNLINMVTGEVHVGGFNTTRTNHTLVCLPDPFKEESASLSAMAMCGVLGSLAVAVGIAHHFGVMNLWQPAISSPHSSPTFCPGSGDKQTLRHSSRESSGSLPSHHASVEQLSLLVRERQRASIGGLELGEMIGRGSFGKVYKGRWRGAIVAVKVVSHDCRMTTLAETLRESALSTSIQHPNVVTTFKVRTVRSRHGSGDASSAAAAWAQGEDGCLDEASGDRGRLLARALSMPQSGERKDFSQPNTAPSASSVMLEMLRPASLPAQTGLHLSLQGDQDTNTSPVTGGARDGAAPRPALPHEILYGVQEDSEDDIQELKPLSMSIRGGRPPLPHMSPLRRGSPKDAHQVVDLQQPLGPQISTGGHLPIAPEAVNHADGDANDDRDDDDGDDEAEPLAMSHKSGQLLQHERPAAAAVHLPPLPSAGASLDKSPMVSTNQPSGPATPQLQESTPVNGTVSQERPSSGGRFLPAFAGQAMTRLLSFRQRTPAQLQAADAAAPGASPQGPETSQKSPSRPHVPSELQHSDQRSDGSAATQMQRAAQKGAELLETWLILEFCDQGSFDHAISAGRYINDMASGVLCLMDIAAGMEHLHSLGVLHADLKGANVLLKSAALSNYDKRGYTCKLADFGLSRVMDTSRTHVSTSTFGTAAYMPAELLLEGRMSKAADVYSFAMMMHELLTGQQLFQGMRQSQIICKVITGWRPTVPPGTDAGYAELMCECWHLEAAKRPAFSDILLRLRKLYAQVRMATGS